MKYLLYVAVLALPILSQAQSRTISGKVASAEDGSALPGVNVIEKGTTNGVVTDADGRYRIDVSSDNATLVFTFIGLKAQEVPLVGRTSVDVPMAQDVEQLSEVVVTALGIERSVKSLPYASQSVNAEQLVIARPNNINDALAGKIAGIQVRSQSGAALDRGATIRIRGAGSLTDKEPLYILDGTPVSSQDINPDDIENINVLKGPAAAALYGQRGDAGVVMMTSKKGKAQPGLGVTVSQNIFFDQVYILPKYQNSYAGGAFSDLAKFTWQEGMPDEWQSLDGKYYHDYTDDGSWGPRMVGQEYIPWYAWIPGTKYTGKTAKLTAQPDNVRDFYQTGVNSTTNVSFSKAADSYNIRLSYTDQSVKGIMPNTSKYKRTLSTQFSYDLGKIITVGGNINYVTQKLNGEYDDGYGNASTGSFNSWFHRDLDMGIMKELAGVKSPGGRYVSWNHFNPTSYLGSGNGAGDKFYNGYYWLNPYSYFQSIDYQNFRDRLYGDISLKFKIVDGFSVSATYRKNQRTQNWENKRPSILPYSFQTELRPTSESQWDYYGTGNIFEKEDNIEILGFFNKNFLDNKLNVDISGGGNIRMEKYTTLQGSTSLGLVVPDLFTLSNSKTQPYDTYNYRSRKEVRSLYARGSFGYNSIVFLEWSLRNDWSSTLPAGKNSYLYPMVGTSFVFSEFLESSLPFLSFGKVRASWAQVGSDLAAYSTSQTYSVGSAQYEGNLTMATPDVLIDPNIKPSLSSSYELGMDLNFLHNRVRFSATYYDETKKDEILRVQVSGTSGYSSKYINAGELNRHGVELQLGATAVQTTDFSWDVTVNWAANRSKVVALVDGTNSVDMQDASGNTFSDSFSQVSVLNTVGQSWGQIVGAGITKIDGKPVLDESGLYVPEQNKSLGSVLPDFTGGVINQVTYKNFTLTFNIDFQKGGKFYSLSSMWGAYSGLTAETAVTNDKGNPIRDAVADGGGVHVVGVNADGQDVDMYVAAKDYFQQGYGLAEKNVFDLDFIKLREVNLAYQIPLKKLGIGTVLKSASVGFVARNFWLIHSNVEGYDPAEISSQFGENGQFPGTRSYGFNVKVGF